MVDNTPIDGDSDEIVIEKSEFELLLLKANLELMQKVNRLIELLEKNHGNGNN